MKIEAVIVCHNYADFLEHTLPENIEQLDNVVVVTHPDDKPTRNLCARLGVDCLDTKEMHRHGDAFNKGRLINLGLSHLRHDGWLLHLDADILLPHRFKQMLAHSYLEETNIYGADRLNCLNFENWMKHRHKTVPQHQWRYMVTPNREFPLGSRLLHQEYGYCPIGYFQLWHHSTGRKYPVAAGSAEHGDVLFAVQWERRHRVLLPEFFVYHLESEDAVMGKNWNGRRTKPFGPCHEPPRPPCPPKPDPGYGRHHHRLPCEEEEKGNHG